MKNITHDEFLKAFTEEWKKIVKIERGKVITSFAENETWTDYMLRYEGFLNKVMDNINKTNSVMVYWRELYTIDAVYVSGPDMLHCKELSFPTELNVAIEHENGSDPEKELWKLAYWRTPLKVLIFYDYHEHQKKSKSKRDWLSEKLRLMGEILDNVQRFWKENELTEYLLLIGNNIEPNTPPVWRMTIRTPNKSFSNLISIE